MRPRPLLCVCLLAIVSVMASGCGIPRTVARAATEGFVEEPEVEIVDLSVARRTGEGVAFAVTVELTNRNQVALPVAEVLLSLEVEGLGAFRAPSPPRVSMPPEGSVTMVLRVSLPAPVPSDASLAGRAYRCAVSTRYVPPGELRQIGTESGLPLPVSHSAIRGTLGNLG